MTQQDGVDALADRIGGMLQTDPEAFRDRAELDAETVKTELANGTFDNHQSIVGFEYEFYAVSQGRWTASGGTEGVDRGDLTRVPRRLLTLIGFEKELGLHNAEMTTSPQPFNPDGLRAQAAEVRSRLRAALETTRQEGMRLVSDGVWTMPPAGGDARSYLDSTVERDGLRIATNMTDSARYHAMGNGPNADRFGVDAPFVSLASDTAMTVALTTSIQPHYQVPAAGDVPLYHNYAVRLAGPLLALGVNSPFVPPELYEPDADPTAILADGARENRIHVFESLNTEDLRRCVSREISTASNRRSTGWLATT
ncbi:MAG: hypothetical protein J07HB67_00690 [halophilic archaeon J07HB67]|jgi:hypothetical protein|nr:MAG: hypothetical protein J07HB67_00690 [halophilic archaeon J07HB67]